MTRKKGGPIGSSKGEKDKKNRKKRGERELQGQRLQCAKPSQKEVAALAKSLAGRHSRKKKMGKEEKQCRRGAGKLFCSRPAGTITGRPAKNVQTACRPQKRRKKTAEEGAFKDS